MIRLSARSAKPVRGLQSHPEAGYRLTWSDLEKRALDEKRPRQLINRSERAYPVMDLTDAI